MSEWVLVRLVSVGETGWAVGESGELEGQWVLEGVGGAVGIGGRWRGSGYWRASTAEREPVPRQP